MTPLFLGVDPLAEVDIGQVAADVELCAVREGLTHITQEVVPPPACALQVHGHWWGQRVRLCG